MVELHPSMTEDWQKSMLRICYQQARLSPDTSTHNYALVLDRSLNVVGAGLNDITDGMVMRPEMLERPTKYAYIEHAERNALYDALRTPRSGKFLSPYLMVCPWAACADCARAIVQSGVRILIRHEHEDSAWNDSIAIGDEMMLAAGVNIVTVKGPLGDCGPVLRNGEWLNP